MPDSYNAKVIREQGGDVLRVKKGGKIIVDAGGEIAVEEGGVLAQQEGIDDLDLTASAEYDSSELQGVADKVDEILGAMRGAGILPPPAEE